MAAIRGAVAVPRSLRISGSCRTTILKRHAATTAAALQQEQSIPLGATTEQLGIPRSQRIKGAKPFSEFLTDTFNRHHDYLRISLTERCNLRCLYCMPEEGIQLSPNKDILTSAEIYYLSALFVNQGVNKIRLTGGEPTVRKDIIPLMQQIGSLRQNGLKELALTTNAISLHRKLDAMVEAGLTGVNISLDTLDPFQFQILTRRQGFDKVMKSINRVQEMNKLGARIKLKINAVIMRGLNDHQILPFIEKTREEDLEVRFIEYMPFGGNKWSQNKMLPYAEMLDIIRARYPAITRLRDAKNDTSKTWQVPGFAGRVGFITSMTHNFCGTCNRLRITSDGNLKVCLHGNTEVSLRDLLREDNAGEPMDEAAFEAIRQIELDRWKTSGLAKNGNEGWLSKERQLLEVIGAAVKRKKAKHAGMGELEKMQNRPMILIDNFGNSLRAMSTLQNRIPSILTTHGAVPGTSFMQASILPKNMSTARRQIRWSSSKSLTTPTKDVVIQDNAMTDIEPRDITNKQLAPKHKTSAESQSSPTEAKLTHLKPSGEAHMVDIRAKFATNRIAIAHAYVLFNNPEPARLILENSNKKGDVLGTARIAGIMAAKRTSDIIPLCHPINITKVDVDVNLLPPGTRLALRSPSAEYGAVEITAQVECVGPTGVEMEALTAVSGAALTVYDMCKAVDRGMRIEGMRLLYKCGGKSGLYVDDAWFAGGGRQFLVERGLDVPG